MNRLFETNKLKLIAVISTLLVVLFGTTLLFASANSNYEKAKNALAKFEDAKRLHKYRDKWMLHITAFERIVKKYPNHKKTCDSLYNIGKLYQGLSEVSYINQDRLKGAKAFEKLAVRCGDTTLADDGLYWAAVLYIRTQDHERARLVLSRLLSRFKKSDMRKRASVLLATLGGSDNTPKAKEQTAKPVTRSETTPATKQKQVTIDIKPKEKKAPNQGTLITPRSGNATLLSVSIETKDNESRLKLHFSRMAAMTSGEIQKTASKPRRLFFDFSGTELSATIKSTYKVGDKRVNTIRFGQYKKDVVRVVFELGDIAGNFALANSLSPPITTISIKNLAAIKPPNLVISKRPVPKKVKPANIKTVEQVITAHSPATVPKRPYTARPVRVIVIDPGHGGDDLGAKGARGTQEKDVVLKLAKKLQKILRKDLGMKVVLTRNSDKDMQLFDRTKIANDLNADIFISLHCNAAPKRKPNGLETFYLNNSSDTYSTRLAGRENKSAGQQISDLEFILTDLSMNVNVNDSILLANMIQKSMIKTLRKKYNGIVDRGVRRAVFHVLLYARMPAVLVEASFISNREEENRLRSNKYLQSVASGIAKGIKSYIRKMKKLNK